MNASFRAVFDDVAQEQSAHSMVAISMPHPKNFNFRIIPSGETQNLIALLGNSHVQSLRIYGFQSRGYGIEVMCREEIKAAFNRAFPDI
ncbi:hypothetical protein AOZ07_11220 [Glutamicibacter halophytocola]|nr:hypothetical protein AOZ07_11220 [Glutamicibacter halophytocola]